MAIIKCSECGKEISDKASMCPNCGCPVSAMESETKDDVGTNKDQIGKKKFNFITIVAIVVVMIIALGGISCILFEKNKLNKYNSAFDYAESGDYERAIAVLEELKDYKDSEKLLEQMKWETKAFSCINTLKEHLKNPESLQIKEIAFYDISDIENAETLIELSGGEPVCIIHEVAQNGFGGNTTGYSFFMYSKDEEKYLFLGNTETLDSDKADKDDEKICLIINKVLEDGRKVGDVDLNRIQKIVKDANYSTIKILE